MNNRTIGISILVLVAIIAAAAAVHVATSDDGGDEHPSTSDANPLESDISELPIGSELVFETAGTYANVYGTYELYGKETYTVISKTSSSISFEVHGTVYAEHNGYSTVFSRSNGDVKSWDLADDHEPSEPGQLSTVFGTVDVKVVDWELQENAGGFVITDLGSTQYWTDTGYGVMQSMNYSIDSTNEVVMVTKTLTSVSVAD